MTSSNRLRALLPAAILVSLIAIGLGAGYYFASAKSDPTVTWHRNPLFITFSSQTGSGSVQDSFTCGDTVEPVILQAFSNQPSTVSLTVNPSSFSSCGSTADNVVVTAACTASAQSSQSCEGDFSGKLFICGPSAYTCLQRSLIVVIAVTTNDNQDNQN